MRLVVIVVMVVMVVVMVVVLLLLLLFFLIVVVFSLLPTHYHTKTLSNIDTKTRLVQVLGGHEASRTKPFILKGLAQKPCTGRATKDATWGFWQPLASTFLKNTQ